MSTTSDGGSPIIQRLLQEVADQDAAGLTTRVSLVNSASGRLLIKMLATYISPVTKLPGRAFVTLPVPPCYEEDAGGEHDIPTFLAGTRIAMMHAWVRIIHQLVRLGVPMSDAENYVEHRHQIDLVTMLGYETSGIQEKHPHAGP